MPFSYLPQTCSIICISCCLFLFFASLPFCCRGGGARERCMWCACAARVAVLLRGLSVSWSVTAFSARKRQQSGDAVTHSIFKVYYRKTAAFKSYGVKANELIALFSLHIMQTQEVYTTEGEYRVTQPLLSTTCM